MSHIKAISCYYKIIVLLGIVIVFAESSVSTTLDSNNNVNDNTNTTIPFFTIAYFEDYILDLLNETLNDSSSECHNALREKFNLTEQPNPGYSPIYIKKLLLESSKTTNELTGFYQCLNTGGLDSTVHLLITVNVHESKNNSNSSLGGFIEKYVFGVCAPYVESCGDYSNIIENMYKNVRELIGLNYEKLEFTVHSVNSIDYSKNYFSATSPRTIAYFTPFIKTNLL